jgi:hypothetical protein
MEWKEVRRTEVTHRTTENQSYILPWEFGSERRYRKLTHQAISFQLEVLMVYFIYCPIRSVASKILQYQVEGKSEAWW